MLRTSLTLSILPALPLAKAPWVAHVNQSRHTALPRPDTTGNFNPSHIPDASYVHKPLQYATGVHGSISPYLEVLHYYYNGASKERPIAIDYVPVPQAHAVPGQYVSTGGCGMGLY